MIDGVFWAAVISVSVWVAMIFLWGKFWWADQRLRPVPDERLDRLWPDVVAVIPARDEAPTIGRTVTSLLIQKYSGRLDVILVDDNSSDGTGERALQAAVTAQAEERFHLVQGAPLADGWSGKLWAVHQGVNAAKKLAPDADYVLLTDADIEHHEQNLRELTVKAEMENRDLVSLMVRLNCQSFWERLLIPAFVFFFQKLYPFPWVNDPTLRMAAAAGGCMLVRRVALADAGGIEQIRGRLIDDCALAALLKMKGSIWLGLSQKTISLRRYDRLEEIWRMVARTAYEQLGYSPLNLIGSIVGMILLYVAPLVALLVGAGSADLQLMATGFAGVGLMALAYLPTLRLYRRPATSALTLPMAGLLYTLMTIDSARRHWMGVGGGWKGRTYDTPNSRNT